MEGRRGDGGLLYVEGLSVAGSGRVDGWSGWYLACNLWRHVRYGGEL